MNPSDFSAVTSKIGAGGGGAVGVLINVGGKGGRRRTEKGDRERGGSITFSYKSCFLLLLSHIMKIGHKDWNSLIEDYVT